MASAPCSRRRYQTPSPTSCFPNGNRLSRPDAQAAGAHFGHKETQSCFASRQRRFARRQSPFPSCLRQRSRSQRCSRRPSLSRERAANQRGHRLRQFPKPAGALGTWSNHARWGEVWRPRADRDFRPYYNGHWEDTREYGWLWVSDDSWGDVPYHYGRWVFDPREGWLWVPGYVWAPSWVVWREGGGNIGWFPMPPGDDYYGDGAYRDNFANRYGYSDWYGPSFGNDQFLSLWIFVGQDHFRDRNFRNYADAATRLRQLLLANDEYDQLRHHQQLRRQPQRRQGPPRAGDQSADRAGARAQRDRPKDDRDASARRPSGRAARASTASDPGKHRSVQSARPRRS